MPDYIPSSDGDFLAWEQNFMNYATLHATALGLATTDTTDLTAAKEAWEAILTLVETRRADLRAAVQLKAIKRKAYEVAICGVVRRLQASSAITDEHRRGLGITVKDGSRTIPMAPPPSRPIGTIDTSQRLRHEIRFVDENSPTRRARPAGVMGCEIWVKIGSPPADPGELTFVALDRASPYVAEYSGADAGKTAYYMLRWVTARGEPGPWSETIAATITG